MEKIGILGGSFDPFHYGHLSIGKAAIEECQLSKIILLPTKVSPFKIGRQMAGTNHRLNMLSMIKDYNKDFELSTFEIEGEEISYTYKTLSKLKNIYSNKEICFVMGADSLITLESWYKGEELLKEFSFIIGSRPGYNKREVEEKISTYERQYGANISLLHNDILDISSTEIKDNIKKGLSISNLVPPCVEEYINEHGLYK